MHRHTQLLALALGASSVRSITVEGGQTHEETDIDADEFLWEKLPGRCCFYGMPDPKHPTQWLGAHTCAECTVWDVPDNYCHSSKQACEDCGMALYCAPTPPLIGGNKVCVGHSRVGHGCDDTLGTGVCATHPLADCQLTCRQHHDCEMFVFYPEEKQGTCILCRDLADTIPTPDAATRIYATTPAPPPPSSPKGKVKHYNLISGPSPPPPPSPPPRPPFRPPLPLAHMGRQHTKQHFECTFVPGVEVQVDTSEGYTDRTAGSKEECCNICGLKVGCQDFVFEPSSGTCVLLPHATQDKVTRIKNEYIISGSLQITVVKKSDDVHGSCEFMPSSGYAGGLLGAGQPLAGGSAIESKQDCCDACDRDERCGKFTYETYSHSCTLYEAYAEIYNTDGLLSGVVNKRSIVALQAPQQADGAQGDGEALWARSPVPPVPPMIAWSHQYQPPPPAPIELDAASKVLSIISLGIGGLMAFAFLLCAYCFFREDVLRLIGVSPVKKGGRHYYKAYAVAPANESDSERRKNRKKRDKNRGGRKGEAGEEDEGDGFVSVQVETKEITQTKEIYLADCNDVATLRKRIRDEFTAICNGKSSHLLIFCREPLEENDDGAAAEVEWQLVVPASDISRVIQCGMLRVTERTSEHSDADYKHAFAPRTKSRGKKASK